MATALGYKEDVQKVRQIIREEFDSRLSNLVITYITEKGMEQCRDITDEDIANAKGNAMFSDKVIKGLLTTARRVATECDTVQIFKFIQYEINPCFARPHDIWKDDYTSETWEEICAELDIDENDNCVEGYFLQEEMND